MPMFRLCAGMCVMSMPSTDTDAGVGDLEPGGDAQRRGLAAAADGPSRLISSPGSTSRSRPSSATVVAERLADRGVGECAHRVVIPSRTTVACAASCRCPRLRVTSVSSANSAVVATSASRPRPMPPCGSLLAGTRHERSAASACSSTLAIVNSPSTTVAVRNDDEMIAVRRFGISARRSVVPHPAPRLRDASTSVLHVDRPDAGVERPERERQREHRVERDQRVVGVEEPTGVRLDRQDAGDERDRWDHVRQHREELDERCAPSGPAGAPRAPSAAAAPASATTVPNASLQAQVQRRRGTRARRTPW